MGPVRAPIALLLLLATCAAPAGELVLRLGGELLRVDTAVTDEERARGLMHRDHLPDDYGLLFVYPRPHRVAFWMKETLVPLDILFFDETGRIIAIEHNVPPCHRDPCPLYRSPGPVSYVLELKGGSAARLGLKVGDAFEPISP